ncbi:MAG: VanW family protein [Thermaerobacter sp.]|nr:VanW family protein [Thermaerobacter sp.]
MRRLPLLVLLAFLLLLMPSVVRSPRGVPAHGRQAAGAHVAAAAAGSGAPTCPPEPAGDPGAPWMLIGHFTTYYPGSSADRNFNLALAAKKLCGQVVPAGGAFSFNQALGQASRENGYHQGHVFIGDRIVPGYGGGVCQVASTIYNAARRAGLPILERHQHGLTVPYLLPGEDSTIAYGYLDLKIRNDTGEPIRLLMRADGARLTAEFFGSRQPPDVRYRHQTLFETPFQTIRRADPQLPQGKEVVDAAGQGGVSVHTWLDRTWPDGRTETIDLGIDNYRPSPRLVRYGTATG